jgi:hypothetical protein
MRKGLLIRVGIDSTAGGWNAPCDEQSFCYVPMGKSKSDDLTKNYDVGYRPYECAVSAFVPDSAPRRVRWPYRLPRYGHFDPDFKHLSYGDCNQRAARIRDKLSDADGSFIVFYAGLRSTRTDKLCYSIIGFYAIERVMSGPSVRHADWHRNAHTRDGGCSDKNTVVVFARRGESGRLCHHIPIGGYRGGAWRVTRKLLDEWGGLDVKDGYIQRSVFLPQFLDGNRFLRWFDRQKPVLIRENNPQSRDA